MDESFSLIFGIFDNELFVVINQTVGSRQDGVGAFSEMDNVLGKVV